MQRLAACSTCIILGTITERPRHPSPLWYVRKGWGRPLHPVYLLTQTVLLTWPWTPRRIMPHKGIDVNISVQPAKVNKTLLSPQHAVLQHLAINRKHLSRRRKCFSLIGSVWFCKSFFSANRRPVIFGSSINGSETLSDHPRDPSCA